MNRPTVRLPITDSSRGRRTDVVAVEEPLEIRAAGQSVAVTMRTPGHDFELAAGFLFTEGVLRSREVIGRISYCAKPQNYNVVNVATRTAIDLSRLSRHVYTASSCGVCGKASLDLIRAAVPGRVERFVPAAELVLSLPGKLREAQTTFAKTGGLHAAGLFDATGKLLVLREDVGRHNALDKVIGERLLAGKLPARETILLVSGRASFELAQKAASAGIPALAAIGAPSSLAIDVAREFGLSLFGFLRDGRFNRYTD